MVTPEENLPSEPKVELKPEPVSLPDTKEEVKTLPRIRLKVEEDADKAKQFATAHGLSMYLKLSKAKRASLKATHKVASWLSPKKKQ